MKLGDKLRIETLRSIRAQLHDKEISKRGKGPLNEEDEISVLQTAVKKRKESIESYEKGGRKDLVDQESKELRIIQSSLPVQMTSSEVGAASSNDLGKVMASAMRILKGKTDGNLYPRNRKKNSWIKSMTGILPETKSFYDELEEVLAKYRVIKIG